MKVIDIFRARFIGLWRTTSRFPLTVLLLVILTVINGIIIEGGYADYEAYVLALLLGIFLSGALQVLYERFFYQAKERMVLIVIGAIITIGYFTFLHYVTEVNEPILVRTLVACLALFVAFLWIPVIKSKYSFNESFMAAFKAFFIVLLFSGVIFLGLFIILQAIDNLLFNINYTVHSHIANIVFVLFAPVYFLSFLPRFPGERDKILSKVNTDQEIDGVPMETVKEQQEEKEVIHQEEKDVILKKEVEAPLCQEESIKLAGRCPKFLEILISYIIIPLTVVFTLILVIYIIRNIGGSFWDVNELESMLVAYSISVITIYILASRIENKFALYFRKIFPKVLVPIVLFQTLSSVLSVGDYGITPDRYFAIIYGVFAIIAGVLFSILPIKKNGRVAAVFIALTIVTIVPPVDAFTISRNSQVNLLKEVLIQNNMLSGNTIRPKDSISAKDKEIIRKTIYFLDTMDYSYDIPWLGTYVNSNFEDTFGFRRYDDSWRDENFKQIDLYLDRSQSLPVAGYDYMLELSLPYRNTEDLIQINHEPYMLIVNSYEEQNIILKHGMGWELVFSTDQIFERFENDENNRVLSIDRAIFHEENEYAKLTIVLKNIRIYQSESYSNQSADMYVLIQIK